MSTARDLLRASLKLIGVLAAGENPTAEEQADALLSLNRMLDSWSTENLIIYAKAIEAFALVGSQQSYTIGVGGNFNTVRPLKIERAAIQVVGTSPTNEVPIQIVNLDQWANITIKGTLSSIPMKLYYEPTNPLGTILLWPIPNVANNLMLYSSKPLTAIASVDTTIALPPGYEDALINNLAIRLTPEYGRPLDQTVVAMATTSKENIKRMNIKPLYLEVDPALVSNSKTFNWRTGE